METHITDITHVIQLAVAPVFLLTAIATLITALNTRLGRIVDRRRILQNRLMDLTDAEAEAIETELKRQRHRGKLIYCAIFSAVLGALFICLVVAGAFLGALLSIDLSKEIAILFVLAMVAMIVCLWIFLREVFLAVLGGSSIYR
ncbi:MAG: DUF2721 domain-containing protein [Dissulfurispiraceae bacterium]